MQLQWDANSEADLLGYRMYRSTQSGFGYQAIGEITCPPEDTSCCTFTDDTILPRETYYYVATAYDSEELESGFSNEVNYTGVCPGDVNGDGNRDILDAGLILNHTVNLFPLTGLDLEAADVNGDGAVNVLDAQHLKNHIVGTDLLDACN